MKTLKPTPYTAYKPSSVEWLGDVPAHWEVRPLKHWVGINEAVLPETTEPDFEFHYLEIGAVGTGVLIEQPNRICFADAPSRARRIVRNGDTIISTVRTYLKAVWTHHETNGNLICSTGFAVLTPREGVAPGFLGYLVQSNQFTNPLTAESVGIAYPAIGEERFSSLSLCFPPLPEQTAIVRYLNHVDERIRRYISAREQLINLLEEQRQAVVQRAVTRGVDPNVRLKPSRVEWLGDVPAHWDVRRLRNTVDMRVSNVDKHVKEDEQPVRLCNYVDVYKNNYVHEQMDFMLATATAEEIERYRLKKDDVLITKDSESWDDIAVSALVTEAASDLISGYHLALLRPRPNEIMGGYLLHALQSKSLAYQFHIEAKGVTRYGLSHNGIKSVWVPLPPIDEQIAIVEYLEKATADINAAISRAHREIELLKEYRARLTADVVTGKLDVREVAFKLPEVPDELRRSDTVDDVNQMKIVDDHAH